MATIAEKQAFIQKVWDAIQGMDLQGFFPSVLIAQAALESNWGLSSLAAKHNNYFGIKAGSSWKGKTVNMKTGEVFNGQNVTINSNFRAYDSLADSIKDRNALLANNSRYKAALTAKTPQEQVQAIKDGGYATALNYVDAVMNTVKANDLLKFDNLKKKS